MMHANDSGRGSRRLGNTGASVVLGYILCGFALLGITSFEMRALSNFDTALEPLKMKPVAFENIQPSDSLWDLAAYLEMDPLEVNRYLKNAGFSWDDNSLRYFSEWDGIQPELIFSIYPGSGDLSSIQNLSGVNVPAVGGVELHCTYSQIRLLDEGLSADTNGIEDILERLGDVTVTDVAESTDGHLQRISACGILSRKGYSYACWCVLINDSNEPDSVRTMICVASQDHFERVYSIAVSEKGSANKVLQYKNDEIG